MAGILTLERIVRHFRGVHAINGVNLDLTQGECLGLIGPNGAGKSTLFRIVAGLLEADSGRILLAGRDVAGLAPETRFRRGLGWAFQHARCFPSLTARQHLEVALAGAGRVGGAAEAAAGAWLQRLGLGERADRPAGRLSLAERKLLDFARAVCHQPRVLLLDEPFAGLSREEAVLLGRCLAGIKAEGATVLLVEHRLAELVQVVDEIAVLAGGRIIHRGAPEETLKAPAVLRAYFGVENE
jgi:branched-chain amino acid transport system ATP-binding protein